MSPFFENDPFFGDLISYARAVARRRGLVALDRLSFDLGVSCALVTGKVKVSCIDLPLPDEAVLFAYARSHYCPLVDLTPSLETIALDDAFADGFVARHVKQRSTLHTLLKDALHDLNEVLDELTASSLVSDFSIRTNDPFYYSIVVSADREDFGLFMPICSVDINVSTVEKSVRNKARHFPQDEQAKILQGRLDSASGTASDVEEKSNQILVAEKKEAVFEIDFGNPLGIPLVPDGLHVTPLPETIVLERNELRLYVSCSGHEKAARISRLPTNSDVWDLALPPGATLRSSAPIIRAAAARLFLLATVGRKKIEISNLLQHKHQEAEPAKKPQKLSFPFDSPNNVLGAYFAFCLSIMITSVVLHPLVSVLGFTILALTVSKDVFDSRAQLLHMTSRLGVFWGPQLALTIFSLLFGLWPAAANLLHMDFLSATLYGSIPLLFSFAIVALDFQPKEERLALEVHEEIHHALSKHMHEITQTTLSVALGNLVRPSKPHAYSYFPEMLIKQMDREIGTLEAVEGFKRLVNDRIKTTEAAVKKTHEGQQHARRTVMAAGGAIFTGYFAFEAGEKVIEFQHLQSKCDVLSFLNLTLNRGTKPGETQPGSASATGTHATTEVQNSHGCNTYEDFHHHQVFSTGMLLLATLVVSLLTAIVTIRKPSDEHGGGGHH